MPASPKPNWRGNAGAASPGRGGVRSWRRPGAVAGLFLPGRGQFTRWLFSTVAWLLSVLAMILFVWLIFIPGCAAPQFGVLTVSEYDRSLPPLSFAKEDAKQFSGIELKVQDLLDPSESAKVRNSLTGRREDDVLVVWLAMLAGRTDDGVLLYQGTSSHPDEQSRTTALPLDEVFKFLKGQTPKQNKQQKLLILDVWRGPIDWRWGQFGVPFASPNQEAELEKAVEDVPHLAILTAASSGEISWSSPQMKRSVFSEMVTHGLHGKADRDGDKRVTLAELDTFVGEGTNHWVKQNRDLRGQHPRLILPKSVADANSLRKAQVGSVSGKPSNNASMTETTAVPDSFAKLIDLWEQRDKLQKDSPEQFDPLAWRRLHEHLRRAERCYLAGQPYDVSEFAGAEEQLKHLHRGVESPAEQVKDYPFVAASIRRATTEANELPRTNPPLPEVHLKQLLTEQALIPKETNPLLVNQAEVIRRRTELLAWRSFRPRVWAGGLLNEADASRRLGEDWLFVDIAHAAQSTSAFAAAENKLKQFEDWTDELSQSRHLLNRLWSELPELAFWAVHRFPVEEVVGPGLRRDLMKRYAAGIKKERFSPPTGEELRSIVKDRDTELSRAEADLLALFQHTRDLTGLLDAELEPQLRISRDGSGLFATNPELIQKLAQLREKIQNRDHGLNAVQSRLENYTKTLLNGSSDDAGQYLRWHELHGALQWTGLNASLRQQLLREWERMDKLLHEKREYVANVKTGQVADKDNATDHNRTIPAESAQRQAQWQALWALQVVSLGLPTELGSSTGDPELRREQQERWVAWKHSVIDVQDSDSLLVTLGKSVRSELRERRNRVSVLIEKDTSLTRSLQLLWRAECAARTLHGYDALLIPEKDDPLRTCRKLEWATLCLWQAERYADDFWGKRNENDPGEAWFQLVADQCVNAAKRINLELRQPGFEEASNATQKFLETRRLAKLELVQKAGRLDLGLGRQQTMNFSATKSPDIPLGLAALWLDPGRDDPPRLEILPTERRALFDQSATAEFTIKSASNSLNAGSNCDPIPVHPRLLFRGRLWNTNEILVNPCLPQGVEIVSLAAPSKGEIVVRGSDTPEIVFILDCSLSMNEPIGNGPLRIDVAKQVLRDTLSTLNADAVEPNKEPKVAVIAYGHRGKKKGDNTELNPIWKNPPDNLPADFWNHDYEWLSSKPTPQKLNQQELARLKKKVEELTYWGNTPLLGSIIEATKPLTGDGKSGGLIVAITDGVWNDGNSKARYDGLKNLFKNHPELSLQLVAFGNWEPAEINALNKLKQDLGAKMDLALDSVALARTLQNAIRSRKYRVTSADSANANSRWEAPLGEVVKRLDTGSYLVSFPNCKDTSVVLSGGERLVFDLDLDKRWLQHLKKPSMKLFNSPTDVPLDAKDEPTRFGYHSARYDETNQRAEIVVALDRDDDLGFVRRPAEIFIGVQPQGAKGRREFSRTIELELDQSVPAWHITIENWPARQIKPEVQAFWKMARSQPEQFMKLKELLAGSQTITVSEQTWQLAASQSDDGKKIQVKVTDVTMANALGKQRESLSDFRVELGKQELDQPFEPASGDVRAQYFEQNRQIVFTFSVSDNFSTDLAVIAVTSRAKREQESRHLDKPLRIEKWDDEQ